MILMFVHIGEKKWNDKRNDLKARASRFSLLEYGKKKRNNIQ